MMDDEVKAYVQKSVLCWLATCDKEGMPNVSPKELFTYYDENTLLVANIASPMSVANIRSNQFACVSFVDVFVQKGFKVKGPATIHEKDSPMFEPYKKAITDLFGTRFPVSAIIEIETNRIDPIVAPSYFLFKETTEESQRASAMKTYGVTST